MSFEDRVAAVGIATQFQEQSNEVFQMVEEETEFAKTQVIQEIYAVFYPSSSIQIKSMALNSVYLRKSLFLRSCFSNMISFDYLNLF